MTYKQWRHLANCSVVWRVSDDMTQRNMLLDKIAAKCVELESKGETACIWHSHFLVAKLSKCYCAKCNS